MAVCHHRLLLERLPGVVVAAHTSSSLPFRCPGPVPDQNQSDHQCLSSTSSVILKTLHQLTDHASCLPMSLSQNQQVRFFGLQSLCPLPLAVKHWPQFAPKVQFALAVESLALKSLVMAGASAVGLLRAIRDAEVLSSNSSPGLLDHVIPAVERETMSFDSCSLLSPDLRNHCVQSIEEGTPNSCFHSLVAPGFLVSLGLLVALDWLVSPGLPVSPGQLNHDLQKLETD